MQVDIFPTREGAMQAVREAMSMGERLLPDAFCQLYLQEELLPIDGGFRKIDSYNIGENPDCYARYSEELEGVQIVRASGNDRLSLQADGDLIHRQWNPDLQLIYAAEVVPMEMEDEEMPFIAGRYETPYNEGSLLIATDEAVFHVGDRDPEVFTARRAAKSVGIYLNQEDAMHAETRYGQVARMENPFEVVDVDPSERMQSVALPRSGEWTRIERFEFNTDEAYAYARFIPGKGDIQVVTAVNGDRLDLDHETGELSRGLRDWNVGEMIWETVNEPGVDGAPRPQGLEEEKSIASMDLDF